jgi:tetratricopeptide (TPR) repeat protein
MGRKSFAAKAAELAKKQPENLDLMDKFRAHYFSSFELSEVEKKSLDHVRSIWSIYCSNTSRLQTIALFKEETGLKEAQCYHIFRQAMKLFGDVAKIDREAERVASSEFYMSIAKIAKDAGDYKTAMECRERVDKLHALFDPDEAKIPIEKLMPPVTFIFTSDVEVLKKQQAGETLDTDYSVSE